MLCADCDNAAAARRAEQIRKALSQIPQPKMDGRTVTVSFGVTEIQPGDTPETMLRRADRALLMAKAKGRNSVVQLGSGSERRGRRSAAAWSSSRPRPDELLAAGPGHAGAGQDRRREARGFVADHQAKIVAIDGNQVRLEIDDKPAGRLRRLTDRPATFSVDVRFEEERVRKERRGDRALDAGTTRTKIKIAVSAGKGRDRRQAT